MSKHYLCGVDYQHEMGMNSAHLYTSIEELKAKSRCWAECGIVELELDEAGNEVCHKWVERRQLSPVKRE